MTVDATLEGMRETILREFGENRRLAHEVLFQHRHNHPTPPFHLHLNDAFHSLHPQVVIEAFRDAAKSTVAEEGIVVAALYGEFRNAVLIGASFPRAKERLTAIKNEFTTNRYINGLLGDMEGPTWGEGRIVLKNGVCITALGAGMSMRGTKYLDARPDLALFDDLEDEESVKTPEMREQKLRWLYRTVKPALADKYRIRFLGNRLDNDAVIVKVAKDPAWRHLRFPVMAQSPKGVERYDLPPGKWVSLWPSKFSLDRIATIRAEYERHGLLSDFNCEYMCEADDPGSKLFQDGQAKVVGRVRTWEAVYAAYDPARTVGARSAMTGKVVFSWIGNKLVLWEGDAKLWLPDEIVDDMLATDDRWGLAELGVEATGLEEFIMQPLRHRAAQRRQLLPLRRLTPPRGKDSFIRGLQPFFKAGEIEFVDVSAEARAQLLSFPTGRKDFPNALAYAQILRPGQPVYEGFGREHVREQVIRMRAPYWLAVHATAQYTAGVLVQFVDGGLRVHADWLREGGPGESFSDILSQASLECGTRLKVVSPRPGQVDTVGLRVAASAQQVRVQNGGDPLKGREAIRGFLTSRKRDEPLITIAFSARWTLNAFAGGYAYLVDKRGQLSREPADGPYAVLMQALESFAAATYALTGDADDRRYDTDASGRRYTTIRATGRGQIQEQKA